MLVAIGEAGDAPRRLARQRHGAGGGRVESQAQRADAARHLAVGGSPADHRAVAELTQLAREAVVVLRAVAARLQEERRAVGAVAQVGDDHAAAQLGVDLQTAAGLAGEFAVECPHAGLGLCRCGALREGRRGSGGGQGREKRRHQGAAGGWNGNFHDGGLRQSGWPMVVRASHRPVTSRVPSASSILPRSSPLRSTVRSVMR